MPKPDPIAAHLSTITGLDVAGLKQARDQRIRLERLSAKLEITDLEPARKAGTAIKRHIRRRLDPHNVVFPGNRPGFVMFHAPPRLCMSIDFELWPRLPGSGGYSIPARPILSGSIGAQDSAQLERLLAAIKAAADLLANILFGDTPNV